MWRYLKDQFELLLSALVIMNPAGGFWLILRNCAHLDGRLSRRRTHVELRLFMRFVGMLLVGPLTYVAVVWAAVLVLGGHPLDPATVQTVKIKDDRWWERVDWSVVQQEFDKIHDYDDWEETHPISPDTIKIREASDELQRPVILIGGAVLLGFGLLILVTLLCLAVWKRYHAGLMRRREIYYDIDLQTIPRDRIL